VLGDSFHYIALMWVALVTAGPLGVLAVRLADSIPALVFGFHGGLIADRLDRRRTMIGADLVRAAVLVPVAIAGLVHHLPIWGLVPAAFVLEAATSYFEPAYGALLPTLVERPNVQTANGLVNATAQALMVGGWGVAAALLVVLPVSAFFAFNAVSFLLSAVILSRVRVAARTMRDEEPLRIRDGFAALRRQPALAVAIATLGVGVTLSSGTWIVGVPQLVRKSLDRGAGSFSLIAASYAVGSVLVGIVLARVHVRRKEQASFAAWSAYLPGYGLFALTRSLWPALAGMRRVRPELCTRARQLRRAGDDSGPDARAGHGIDLARPSRRTRDRPPRDRAAVRVLVAAHGLCRGGGRDSARRSCRCAQRSSSRSSSNRDGAKPSILSIAPAAAAAAAAGIKPTSSEPDTSTPHAAASASTRARMSCSAAAS
jgi:hypothetical protein